MSCPIYGDQAFPALKDVFLQCTSKFVSNLLSAITTSNLRYLDVSFMDSYPDLALVISKIMLNISADSLAEIFIVAEANAAQPTPFNISSLLPLCKFNQLKVLKLSWPTIKVQDRDIDLLTSSLMNLVELEIASLVGISRPLLTRRGLGQVARNCPKLCRLGVSVDFSAYQDDKIQSIPSKLEYLNTFHSPPGNPNQTTLLIHSLFPKLTTLVRYGEDIEQRLVIAENLQPLFQTECKYLIGDE